MASYAFITEQEAKIIEAAKLVNEVEKALSFETSGHTKGCLKENVEIWGTLGCNLSALAARSSKVYEKIQQARRMAENL